MKFRDARELDGETALAADLCIVGSGAAGIAIAREFLHGPVRVVMLEGGGLKFRHGPQLLYLGEQVGRDNFSTAKSRFRMFGGTTTRWGKVCRPLDAIDFEARPSVPHSGWPFDRAHLDPYYRRAHAVANLGPYTYRPEDWGANGVGCLPVGENGAEIRTAIYQFSHPSDFGVVYREQLEKASNVEVFLNAPLVEIETDETAQTVTGVRIRPTGSKTIPVVARHYVLACGGIENPRLLLAANRVAAAGLGNQNDLVGRFYTDHLYHWPGYFEPASARYDRSLNVIEGYAGMGRNQRAFAAFTLSEEVRRERGLNGAAAYLIRRPRFKAEPEYASEGGVAFTHLIDVLTHAELPDRRLGERFREALAGRRQVRRRVGMQVRHLLRPESRLSIRSVVEMTPNADSRVTLGTAKDRFGMPRVRVDWRLNADDRRGLDQLHAAMHAELRRCGLGTFVQHEMKDRNGWPPSTTGGKHHMGTTRMHTDPRQGVVDPDCRVHGMTNLFVAGSSVFPTGGYVNPTLTIVALAIRLADHLKAQFRERGRP